MSQDWTTQDVLKDPAGAVAVLNGCLSNAVKMRGSIGILQARCRDYELCLTDRDNRIKALEAEVGQQKDEIERLQTKRLEELCQFLEEEYPKVDGPGWLSRDTERRYIKDFLTRFEAEAAKG